MQMILRVKTELLFLGAIVLGLAALPSQLQAQTFSNTAFAAQTERFEVQFDTTISTSNSDLYHALSNGPATRDAMTAAVVRFNTSGVIDVRNASAFAATNRVTYSAGQTFHIRMVVNVPTKRYSVYIRRAGSTTETLLANSFRFRTDQLAVPRLNNRVYARRKGAATVTAFAVTNLTPPPNSPPSAVNDQASVHQDTSVLVNVLSNDSDPNGDALTVTGVTAPSNGVVAIVSNQISYTPNSGFFGTDQVTYTVSDGVAQSQAQVNFTVHEDSDPDEAHKHVLTQGTDTLGTFNIGPIVSNDQHGTRLPCVVSHFSYDDPVVYPNQPDLAHLHMFWGNTETDAFSTSNSIATQGNSTCTGGTINRSSYWMPALLNANMETVLPTTIWIYYKSFVQNRLLLRPIPPGLQILAHRNVRNAGDYFFKSINHDGITFIIDFPNCVQVDGSGNPVLSSVGGTSHLAYDEGNCPASHPYMIPSMSINVNYNSVDYNSAWQLSSDTSPLTKGQSLHADYIAGWTPANAQQMRDCVADSRECGLNDANGAQEMFLAPSGTPVYQDVFTIYPGFDITPFGSSLPKYATVEHSH